MPAIVPSFDPAPIRQGNAAMNSMQTAYKVKSSYFQQWKKGVGTLWYFIKFYFLAAIYTLPCLIVQKVIDSLSFETKGIELLVGLVGLVIAIINVPLAVTWAGEDMGFERD
jgi:hypothetical protein